MQRKQEPEKYCENCGKKLIRMRYSGRLEDFSAFQNRKYCSLTCANTKKTVTEAGHRWRAEQLRKDSCEICGTRSRLHAHHIDGNITHNWQGNIQTLCFDCHMAHHRLCRRLGRTVPGRAELRELQAGFPLGWTDLSASETPSCPSSSTPSSGQ